MEFGALMMFRNPRPWRRPMQAVYRDLVDLCVVAEQLGFDHLWTSEHHFLDDGWSPSQLPILSAIAARTERIRIGTFVLLLPFHNPIRVAEDAATVDIISNGRVDLAVGPGSDPGDYATLPSRPRSQEFPAGRVARRPRSGDLGEGVGRVRGAVALAHGGALPSHGGGRERRSQEEVGPGSEYSPTRRAAQNRPRTLRSRLRWFT